MDRFGKMPTSHRREGAEQRLEPRPLSWRVPWLNHHVVLPLEVRASWDSDSGRGSPDHCGQKKSSQIIR